MFGGIINILFSPIITVGPFCAPFHLDWTHIQSNSGFRHYIFSPFFFAALRVGSALTQQFDNVL